MTFWSRGYYVRNIRCHGIDMRGSTIRDQFGGPGSVVELLRGLLITNLGKRVEMIVLGESTDVENAFAVVETVRI
jgi:hypothetical protein